MNKVDVSAAVVRGGRVFLASLLALIGYSFTSALSGLTAVPINLNDPKKTMVNLGVCFLVGFLAALSKAARDKFSDVNGNGKVNYLPL